MRLWALILCGALVNAGGCRSKPSPPEVAVVVTAPGASALEVEARIAEPFEAALASLPAVTSLRSESRPSEALVRVSFAVGTDPLVATSAVSGALSLVQPQLPAEANPPSISLAGGEVLLSYALAGDRASPLEVARVHRERIVPALARLGGVGGITSCGEATVEVKVEVSAARLSAYGVSFGAVLAALNRQFESTDDLQLVRVGEKEGEPVRLQDVATVSVGPAVPECDAFDGSGPVVAGTVRLQPGADRRATAAAVESQLAELGRALPPGWRLHGLRAAEAQELDAVIPADPRRAQRTRLAAAIAKRAAEVAGAEPRALALSQRHHPDRVELVVETPSPEAVLSALAQLPDVKAHARSGAGVLQARVVGDDLDTLARAAAEVVNATQAVQGVRATIDNVATAPTFEVKLDRERLADAGVTTAEVAQLVQAGRAGVEAGMLWQAGSGRAPIRVRVAAAPGEPANELDGRAILNLPVVTAAGRVMSLAELVSLQLAVEPAVILRVDRRRALEIRISVGAGGKVARHRVRESVAQVRLPAGVAVIWAASD